MAVTLKDVAKKAGVGMSTVSYVLNGTGLHKVGQATQERILSAARSLNYSPNISAKGLSKGKTFLAGVVIQQIITSFVPEIIQGLEDFFNENNYSIILCTYHTFDELKKKCETLCRKRVDGIIVFPEMEDKFSQYYTELHSQVPLVTVTGKIDGVSIPSAMVSGERIGYMAMEHLLKLGHRRIAYAGPETSARYEGMRNAAIDAGIDIASLPVFNQERYYDFETGHNIFEWIGKLSSRPTAVIAESDISAVGIINAAVKAGMKLPHELSIIGVDGLGIGKIPVPALTSIGQPTYEQGRLAGKLLLQSLDKKRLSAAQLKPYLIERESCCAVDY